MSLSQADRILLDLKRGLRITPMSALKDYGCFRLAARINNLARLGHDIVSEKVTEGGKTFARYHLRGDGQQEMFV